MDCMIHEIVHGPLFDKSKFNFWYTYWFSIKLIFRVNILHCGSYKMKGLDLYNESSMGSTIGGGYGTFST